MLHAVHDISDKDIWKFNCFVYIIYLYVYLSVSQAPHSDMYMVSSFSFLFPPYVRDHGRASSSTPEEAPGDPGPSPHPCPSLVWSGYLHCGSTQAAAGPPKPDRTLPQIHGYFQGRLMQNWNIMCLKIAMAVHDAQFLILTSVWLNKFLRIHNFPKLTNTNGCVVESIFFKSVNFICSRSPKNWRMTARWLCLIQTLKAKISLRLLPVLEWMLITQDRELSCYSIHQLNYRIQSCKLYHTDPNYLK